MSSTTHQVRTQVTLPTQTQTIPMTYFRTSTALQGNAIFTARSPQPLFPKGPSSEGPGPRCISGRQSASRSIEHRAPASERNSFRREGTRERERECWSVCTHAGAARIFGMLTPVHRGIGTSQPRQKVPAVEGITASQDKADLLPSQLLRALTSHLLPSPWRTG